MNIEEVIDSILTSVSDAIKAYVSGEAFKEDVKELIDWLYKVN